MHLYRVYRLKGKEFVYCCQFRGSSPRDIWGRLRDSGMEGTFYYGTSNSWRRYASTGDGKGIYKATFSR